MWIRLSVINSFLYINDHLLWLVREVFLQRPATTKAMIVDTEGRPIELDLSFGMIWQLCKFNFLILMASGTARWVHVFLQVFKRSCKLFNFFLLQEISCAVISATVRWTYLLERAVKYIIMSYMPWLTVHRCENIKYHNTTLIYALVWKYYFYISMQ